MKRKNKRWKNKDKKLSLPNDVSPIFMPHYSETKIDVDDDILDDDIDSLPYGTMSEEIIDDDFVMPIIHCDNYD